MSTILNKLSPREHALSAIVETIEKGVLAAGTQLPSENNLADYLHISRGTVRSALAELLRRGVLEKRGRRLYVREPGAESAVPELLAQSLLFLGTSMAEPEYLNRNPGVMDAVEGGAIAAASCSGIPFFSLNIGRMSAKESGRIGQLRVPGALLFHLLPAATRMEEIAGKLRQSGVPLLAFSAFTLLPGIAHVLPDQRLGMRMLTRELLRRGFRRILFYASDLSSYYWQRERYAGYREMMEAAGFPEYPRPCHCYTMRRNLRELVPDRTTFEDNARQAAGYLLDCFAPGVEPPEVIVAETDWTAQIIAAALRLLHKMPGVDVQITGYDNKCDHSPWNEFESFRPLLTVDRQNALIGRTMVEELHRAILEGVQPGERKIPPILFDDRDNPLCP